MTANYCRNCGTKNEEGEGKFCIKCGEELKPDSREPEDEIEEVEDEIEETKFKSKININQSIIAGIIVIILIGGGIFALTNSSEPAVRLPDRNDDEKVEPVPEFEPEPVPEPER